MVGSVYGCLSLLAAWFRVTSCLSLWKQEDLTEACIEDMCVRGTHRQDATILDRANEATPNVQPGCRSSVQIDARIMLLTLVAPWHGSTALEGVLMSSKNVATLCPWKHWLCEGRKIMQRNGYDKNNLSDWNFTDMLKLYSEVWDVRRSVLLEKTPSQVQYISLEYQGILEATIPESLQQKNVHKISPVYVLMWRPFCLGPVSSNFRNLTVAERIQSELTSLSLQYHGHKYLVSMGTPVLVINFADLIWRSDYTESRLKQFLPCLGQIDIDYVPKLGVDIFIENQWKVDGSVREFGAIADPLALNYDVYTSQCGTDLNMSSHELSEYNNFVNYLSSFS